tara:strand:+ start:62140 stop:62394 length:255 start_codon:yes stop_codon:yes gene_type:complete
MAINSRDINKLHNNSVLLYDEVSTLRRDMKAGFKKVVEANRELDPANKKQEVGAWRKVEDPSVETERPLVKSDADRILKKLDII